MSLQYATIVTCFGCMAKIEVSTDWRSSKLVERTLRACTCGEKVEDLSDPNSYPPVRTCQTPGCVKSCRFRFCLECSSARQADAERNRNGPLPKCGCGVQLTHRQSVHCRDCKRKNNTEWQRANNERIRAELAAHTPTPEDG